MRLASYLNALNDEDLRATLTRCCASQRWVQHMAAARPFTNDGAVTQHAASIWQRLGPDDWREAFAAHPQIGDLNSLRARFADTRAWAGGEQAGTAGAAENTLLKLAEFNREYLTRFGYIFVVFATGKSAEQMLSLLETRLCNSPDVELPIAAGEQLKITLLRLQKLVS